MLNKKHIYCKSVKCQINNLLTKNQCSWLSAMIICRFKKKAPLKGEVLF